MRSSLKEGRGRGVFKVGGDGGSLFFWCAAIAQSHRAAQSEDVTESLDDRISLKAKKKKIYKTHTKRHLHKCTIALEKIRLGLREEKTKLAFNWISKVNLTFHFRQEAYVLNALGFSSQHGLVLRKKLCNFNDIWPRHLKG